MPHACYVVVRGLLVAAAGPLAGGCFSPSSAAPPALSDASVSDAASEDDATTGPEAAAGHDATTEASAAYDAGPPTIDATTILADASLDADATAASDGATTGDDAATTDAAGEAGPAYDAGAGCVAPGTETALSATAEGLPPDGMVLWVRADHGVYMTATNDVCAWQDQSSTGRLLTPDTARPTWQASSVGGQPAIHFSAVGMDLGTGDTLGIPATGARTFIAVEQLVITNGRFHPILQGDSNSSNVFLGIDANTWQTAGYLEGAYVCGNSYDTALTTAAMPRVHVLTMSTMVSNTLVSTAADYRINGTPQTLSLRSGSGALVDFSTANFTTIGDVSGTPSTTYGDAIVAEAILYDRALDVGERAAVEAVLEARYGIQPDSGTNPPPADE